MGYSNNLITAPVGIGDISQALNNSSTDLGTLCNSNSIKKWAKYKPEHWDYSAHGNTAPPIGYLTDSDRRNNHYGLEWFKYRTNSAGPSSTISDWRTLMLGAVSGGLYYYFPRDTYFNGTSNVLEPKRIADFLAFNNGTPYTDSDNTRKGYWNKATGPVVSASVTEWTYGEHNTNRDKISVTWGLPNDNSLDFSDFTNLSGLYFGVLFYRIPNNYIGTAASILGNASNETVTLVWHIYEETDDETHITTYTPDDSYETKISNGTALDPPISFIDAEDVYRAKLTPTPLSGTAEYVYICVPVLFRRGLINDFNKGYCAYSLAFPLSSDIGALRAIPLPISSQDMTPSNNGDPFILTFGSKAQSAPYISLQITQIGAEGVINTTNATINSITVFLQGPDDQSGFQWSREVKVKLYRGSDPADNPASVSGINEWTIQPTEGSEYIINNNGGDLNITLDYENPAPLRCCAYLTTSPSGFGLISDDVLIKDKADLSD